MNKKGYTLLEILVVVAMVATVGLLATISLEKVINNSKDDKYEVMISEIEEATNTYITIYEKDLVSELNNLYNSGTSFTVSVKTLQDVLLIDNPLKDPRNNKTISGENTIVTVSYSSDILTFTLGTINYVN